MRRLTINPRVAEKLRVDDGATLVFVAVILVALLALTAFAVDFGRMWEERRQLQNGADAAALAIAEDCARGLCDGSYDEYGIAEIYVDANARDGRAWAYDVDLDMVAHTVTVRNATEDPGGDNKFDMLFAGIVGFDGFTVGAEATVAWGNPLQVATVPIIISECEWIRPGHDGTEWLAQGGAGEGSDLHGEPSQGANADPTYAELYTRQYTTQLFHTSSNPAVAQPDCAAPAGQDVDEDGARLNGGFGYLAAEGDCEADVYGVVDNPADPDYGWVGSDTGNDGPDCSEQELEDLLLDSFNARGRTVFIPYFDQIWDKKEDGGSSPCENTKKCYHIAGYGGFHVVGYKLSGGGNKYTEWVYPLTKGPKSGPDPWCGNPRICLVGYFTNAVYQGPAVLGGEDRGITVIKFTG